MDHRNALCRAGTGVCRYPATKRVRNNHRFERLVEDFRSGTETAAAQSLAHRRSAIESMRWFERIAGKLRHARRLQHSRWLWDRARPPYVWLLKHVLARRGLERRINGTDV